MHLLYIISLPCVVRLYSSAESCFAQMNETAVTVNEKLSLKIGHNPQWNPSIWICMMSVKIVHYLAMAAIFRHVLSRVDECSSKDLLILPLLLSICLTLDYYIFPTWIACLLFL